MSVGISQKPKVQAKHEQGFLKTLLAQCNFDALQKLLQKILFYKILNVINLSYITYYKMTQTFRTIIYTAEKCSQSKIRIRIYHSKVSTEQISIQEAKLNLLRKTNLKSFIVHYNYMLFSLSTSKKDDKEDRLIEHHSTLATFSNFAFVITDNCKI